ncbi:MAG: hypothetical protein ACO391_14995, partial [Pseudomonadales bacterium]
SLTHIPSPLYILNLPMTAVVFATSAPPNSITWLDATNYRRAGIEVLVMEGDERGAGAESTNTSSVFSDENLPKPLTGSVSSNEIDTFSILASTLRSPDAANNAAAGVGADGPVRTSMANRNAILFADDLLVEGIATEIDAARIDVRSNLGAAGPLIFASTNRYICSGVRRLSNSDVAALFSFINRAYRSWMMVNAMRCKSLKGRTSPSAKRSTRWVPGSSIMIWLC